jgi:hypothetical protein
MTKWGYFIWDDTAQKTLIYTTDGTLWGELIFNPDTSQVDVYKY